MLLVDQLIILFLLSISGEPVRRLVSRRVKILESLDLIQIMTLDFYLGGLIFFVLAIFPFGLYTRSVTIAIIAFSILISFSLLSWKYLKGLKNFTQLQITIRQVLESRATILTGFLLVTFFLLIFWIEAGAAQGIIFGNVHDASLFSAIAKLISKNGMIPSTLSPFDPSGIIYPQAFSVIQVFAAYVFNAEPANMILLLVPLFQALTVFAAYFLGKLWSNKTTYGLLFAFLFTFFSNWPKHLVWGSYAFVAAFPLYLVVLGLVGIAIRKKEWLKFGGRIEFLFLGLLIGYLGAIHAVFYEVIFATLFFVVLFWIISLRREALRGLSVVFIIFISSLLPVSVFLYRFVISANVPGQNVGLPSDIIAPQLSSLVDNSKTLLTSFFDRDWISPYPDAKIITIFVIVSILAMLVVFRKYRWDSLLSHSIGFLSASLIGGELVILMASKELGFSFLVTAFNVPETAIILFASLILLTGIGLAILFDKIHTMFRFSLKKIARWSMISFLFVLLFSPFIYYTLTADMEYCHGIYNLLSITTPEDYQLILNMKNQLPTNSAVLINPYDAGGFIPSIDGYRAIYLSTGSRSSVSYTNLCNLILKNNLNETTYTLMSKLNITNIFVGSRAVYSDGVNYLGGQQWDPMLFLGNPNFNLVNQVSSSYLFAFTPKKSTDLFFDDFENSNIQHNGWRIEIEAKGKDSANVSLSSDPRYRFSGNQSLMLTTKGFPDEFSVVRLYRMFYLPSSTENVTLDFYLNSPSASQQNSTSSFYISGENWNNQFSLPSAFQSNEGLSIIISNENWTQQLSLSTWDEQDAVRLLRTPGFYQINLPSLWLARFHTPLPSHFFIKTESFSSDGQESVFYLDSIGLKVGSNAINLDQNETLRSGATFG